MITKLLTKITFYLIRVLIKRGVNVPDKVIEMSPASLKLIQLQGEISIMRANIIESQRDLIRMVEPTLFRNLAETNDSWEKTSITKSWYDKVDEINVLINEHQTVLNEFDEVYNKIEANRKL